MTDKVDQSPHNIELQSLRGIAAMVVMVHHSLRVYRGEGWTWMVSDWLLNAQAAVIVFFVLSGYVLSRSLARRGLDRQGLTTFYIRRGFRIYPALWVGIAFGAIYALAIRPLPATHLSDWVMGHYIDAQMKPASVFGSLVGANNYLLPPSWTITAELCASLFLPAAVWMFLRYQVSALPVIVLLGIIGYIAGPTFRMVPYYSIDFALGAALGCVPWMRFFHPGNTGTLLALVTLLFAQLLLFPKYPWAVSVVEGLCSLVLVAGLTTSDRPWLRRRWLVTIGDWSYSIYLLHLPIAFSIAHLLDYAGLAGSNGDASALIVAMTTTLITVPLSGFIYSYVELPGIAAGAAAAGRCKMQISVKSDSSNGQMR